MDSELIGQRFKRLIISLPTFLMESEGRQSIHESVPAPTPHKGTQLHKGGVWPTAPVQPLQGHNHGIHSSSSALLFHTVG